MATYDCDDFRVSFARADADSYAVIATAADGQQVRTRFTLPTTDLEQAVIALGRGPSRDVESDAETAVHATAENLGRELADALFDTILGPFYELAIRLAQGKKRGLRLTLSLAATPELLSVPWELLYRNQNFLASQRKTPVVRYLEVGEVPPPLPVDGALRVLGVVASPTGMPQLNTSNEKERVETALAGMLNRGLVTLDWCDPATPKSLREQLRDGSYHVLHYIGHSDFTATGDGLLFLENETGGPAPVTESVLKVLLGDQTSLRLTVLNSCEGARTTLTDPFAGIATSLVALGVPAVIAMQFTISDDAAIAFAGELFTSLIGRQYPIDAAVAEARKAVFCDVNEIEWATPVLFLRSEDGRLFDFALPPETLPLARPPTPIVADDPPTTPTLADETNVAHPLVVPTPTPRPRPSKRLMIASAAAVIALIAVVVATTSRSGQVARSSVAAASGTLAPGTVAAGTVAAGTVAAGTVAAGTVTVGAVASGALAGVVNATSQPLKTRRVPNFPSVTTCAGQPAPARPAYSGPSGAEAKAFQIAQQWSDWIAQAEPNSADGNAAVWNELQNLFPDKSFTNAVLNNGYTNLAVNHLLYRAATAAPTPTAATDAGVTTIDVSSVIYDNPFVDSSGVQKPCRSGFVCLRFTVDTVNGKILARRSASPVPRPDPASSSIYTSGKWFAPDEPAPTASLGTVEAWLNAACSNVTYR